MLLLRYYFDWKFLLSLVTGSILCATDPVAVVALLKELGASPVLTIQIQAGRQMQIMGWWIMEQHNIEFVGWAVFFSMPGMPSDVFFI